MGGLKTGGIVFIRLSGPASAGFPVGKKNIAKKDYRYRFFRSQSTWGGRYR